MQSNFKRTQKKGKCPLQKILLKETIPVAIYYIQYLTALEKTGDPCHIT
jgi:hypothetical protein